MSHGLLILFLLNHPTINNYTSQQYKTFLLQMATFHKAYKKGQRQMITYQLIHKKKIS